MAEHDDAAVRWAIRLDAGPLSPEDQMQLDDWLAKNERAAGALLRAEAALVYLEGGSDGQRNADLHRLADHVDRKRRSFLTAVLVAGTMAAGLVGVMLSPSNETFSTTIGEVRKLPLADGSTATINTSSQLSVVLEPEQRRVVLEDGEAWFEVAHDAKRPFIVIAGDVHVRAVGTAFSVRRHGDGIDVLVTQGAVETWKGRAAAPTRLSAGQRAFIPQDVSKIVAVGAVEEIERALAWRNGELALNGEPLSYAVTELNRYNRHKIIIEDPVLSRMPIVGFFRTDNPAGFADSIAEIIGASVIEKDNAIIISPKRN